MLSKIGFAESNEAKSWGKFFRGWLLDIQSTAYKFTNVC
jgi:hypothetical protein